MSLAYVSFDVVPTPKGAATHIEAFAKHLGREFQRVDLVTVASGTEVNSGVECWPGVFQTELPAVGCSLIDRVLCFRAYLTHWLKTRRFAAIQFRSIFEGYELLKRQPQARFVYEVNGLPSIELKYRYPGSEDDRELMRKVVLQEKSCLERADLVVTPSSVTSKYLNAAAKTRVITNGVDTDLFGFSELRERDGVIRLCYFGTLTSWQGVDLAVRALSQIRQKMPAELRIIGSGNERQRDSVGRLAGKLGVAPQVIILPPVSQLELVRHLHGCDVILAPLPSNDRNVLQGCCPLKILEAMASGVPLVATDLPVTSNLGRNEEHFLLVKPGSVDQIAEAVVWLALNPDRARFLAKQARAHVEANYTWERAGAALLAAYQEFGISRFNTV